MFAPCSESSLVRTLNLCLASSSIQWNMQSINTSWCSEISFGAWARWMKPRDTIPSSDKCESFAIEHSHDKISKYHNTPSPSKPKAECKSQPLLKMQKKKECQSWPLPNHKTKLCADQPPALKTKNTQQVSSQQHNRGTKSFCTSKGAANNTPVAPSHSEPRHGNNIF